MQSDGLGFFFACNRKSGNFFPRSSSSHKKKTPVDFLRYRGVCYDLKNFFVRILPLSFLFAIILRKGALTKCRDGSGAFCVEEDAKKPKFPFFGNFPRAGVLHYFHSGWYK